MERRLDGVCVPGAVFKVRGAPHIIRWGNGVPRNLFLLGPEKLEDHRHMSGCFRRREMWTLGSFSKAFRDSPNELSKNVHRNLTQLSGTFELSRMLSETFTDLRRFSKTFRDSQIELSENVHRNFTQLLETFKTPTRFSHRPYQRALHSPSQTCKFS